MQRSLEGDKQPRRTDHSAEVETKETKVNLLIEYDSYHGIGGDRELGEDDGVGYKS